MNLAAVLDVQDLADAEIARIVSGHPHRRALARALFRAARNTVAIQEGDETAAEMCFSGFRKHREKASYAVRKSGSQR